MNTTIKKSLHSCAMIVGSGFLIAFPATAQTFNVIHTFSASALNSSGYETNSDGISPIAALVAAGGRLYGTAGNGGTASFPGGTVFAVNTDGTGFSILHIFSFQQSNPYGPSSGFVLSGNTLYGTTGGGGTSGYGTAYNIKTNGTGFTVLKNFNGTTDGNAPSGGLILLGSNLHGMTENGANSAGNATGGTVYRVSTSGGGFAVLFTFSANSPGYGGSTGGYPQGGLVASGSNLFGTCISGGGNGVAAGHGTVFKVNTDGSLFTVLHSFSGTGNEGANPCCTLVLSNGTLYGTTQSGGNSGQGTVFRLNTDGSGFTTLHSFSALVFGTNSDGANPYAGLLMSGNTLYGTAAAGGGAGNGTVFSVNTDGTGFTNLHSFSASRTNSSGIFTNSDGITPNGTLTLVTNVLYGTAYQGGLFGNGTVFSIVLPDVQPQLTITPAGTNVVLTWPTTPVGFTLESTTSVVPPITWTSVSPLPILVNGRNTVTNPMSAAQQFYRLSQ